MARIRESSTARYARLQALGWSHSQARGHPAIGELSIKEMRQLAKGGKGSDVGLKLLAIGDKRLIESYKKLNKNAPRSATGGIIWTDAEGHLKPEAERLIKEIQKREKKGEYDFGPGGCPRNSRNYRNRE